MVGKFTNNLIEIINDVAEDFRQDLKKSIQEFIGLLKMKLI